MISFSKADKPLKGRVFVPGDKSISHRSIMFGAISEGTTEITGFLSSADCISTIECFKNLGITIDHSVHSTNGVPTITVHGKGQHGLKAPKSTLYAGNSGTTIRLMSGLLSAQPFDSMITGDASIQKRPMKRVIDPLTQMGAQISSVAGNGCAPLMIKGGSKLHGITYHSPVPSAQVKSSIVLAGLGAEGTTIVHEQALSRNHTEIMLKAFGADIRNEKDPDGGWLTILNPGSKLTGTRVNVPADISSAAYFIAAALIVPGSELVIHNVGINATRAGLLDILIEMGADITINNIDLSSEPRADLIVKYSRLHGNPDGEFVIGGGFIPRMIDELPIMAVIAAYQADCKVIIKDAQELKVKESNRIDTVVEALSSMGCDIEATDDGMIINPGCELHGADIHSHNDHRIAMSFAIAALGANGTTRIIDDECVGISYPEFYRDLSSLL